MSRQRERQQSVRAVTGTNYNYSDDWHALFDQAGIAEGGSFNERRRSWINSVLGTSFDNVNDAMRMFAIEQGVSRWSELGTFTVPSPATLPTGAVGVYYMSDYTASPRPYVPNAVATGGAPVNLLNNTRRGFSVYEGSNRTVTENAAVAPNGKTEAATVVASNSSWLFTRTLTGLAAGTYTFAVHVKSNSASSETFQLYDGTGARGASTATTTWQRFSCTFTTGSTSSPQIGLFNNSTAASLQVTNFELYLGASDLGPEPEEVGNLYLDAGGRLTAAHTYADGVLDMTAAGSTGLIEFPAALTLDSGITVVGIAKNTVAGDYYAGFIARRQPNSAFGFLNFITALEWAGGPQLRLGGNLQIDQGTYNEFWNFNSSGNNGWHGFGHRYGAAESSIWVDSGKIFTAPAGTAPTLQDFHFSNADGNQYGQGWQYAAFAIYPRVLTDEEMVQAQDALFANVTVSAGPIRLLWAEGDSITAENPSYLSLYTANANPVPIGGLGAISGTTISEVLNRLPKALACKPADVNASSKFIYSLMTTNGLTTVGASTAYITTLQNICTQLRNAGWIVALMTLTPRADATYNTNRAAINTAIRTWVGTYCDIVVDFAADATMGPDAAASNLTYYRDGIHPTAAGHAILETIYRTAINSL